MSTGRGDNFVFFVRLICFFTRYDCSYDRTRFIFSPNKKRTNEEAANITKGSAPAIGYFEGKEV